MEEIYKNIFIGSDYDCLHTSRMAVIHACKTCHQKALNYTKSLPQTHPNYLIAEEKNNLYLNMVDMSRELSPLYTNPVMSKAMEFIDKSADNGKILIHCNQGMSRSPSIGLLFLARKNVINNTSYRNAKSDFLKIYPFFSPGTGIELYMAGNWNDLLDI